MADFTEFFESTAELSAPDSDRDEFGIDETDEPTWQRIECEVVVCLVDCNAEMFRRPTPLSTRSNKDVEINPVSALRPREGEPSPQADDTRSSIKDSGCEDSDAAPAAQSFFSMTLQSIHTLLTEKIVWTNNDKVAVVLFNTRECANAAQFPGIYVSQEATSIGTQYIQRVEQLEAAGVYGSHAYDEFAKMIGHRRDPTWNKRSSTNAESFVQENGNFECRFSDVLWEARRVLLSAYDPDAIQHRRLFVFTNESDPTQGCAKEWEQCRERAHALADLGATLEVFGFGDNTTDAGPFAGLTSRITGEVDRYSSNDTTIAHSHSAQLPIVLSTDSLVPDVAFFDSALFWNPLLQEMKMPSSRPPRFTEESSAAAARHVPSVSSSCGGSVGTVYIHAGSATLHELLSTVARRAHPQRPFRRCVLRIGRLVGQEKGGDVTSVSTSAVPRMAVGLYAPLLRARPPRHAWLDRQTKRPVQRVVYLRKCKDNTEEGAQNSEELGKTDPAIRVGTAEQEEVKPDDVCFYAKVGEDRVYFTKEERQKITAVAAGDAEPGFTILFFKDVEDVLHRAHIVHRSLFLHACVEKGGLQSHRLFVLLVRRLRAKGKAAIAQYRHTSRATPRLLALVPSLDITSHPEKRYQVPVEGLGLYMVPLPFAEDLRRVPHLSACTLVNRKSTPCLEDNKVDPVHLELAKEVIAALTEPYNTDERTNPALQRQYGVLQRLAQQRYPMHRSIFEGDDELSSGLAEKSNEEKGEAETLGDESSEPQDIVDSTLPNSKKMLSLAHCFHVFNREVLGSDYDAAKYCPPRPSTPHAVRRPRVNNNDIIDGVGGGKEGEGELRRLGDVIRDAAARNAWDFLTVPLLREYLLLVGVNTGAARRKAELIELARTHVFYSTSTN